MSKHAAIRLAEGLARNTGDVKDARNNLLVVDPA
jgi:hypothetical protein